MALRRKRKSKTTAPVTVYFTQAKNDQGHKQPAVYAECTYGDARAGPVWGHTRASVNRCLATLSKFCDCGRPYHAHKFTEGIPIQQSD